MANWIYTCKNGTALRTLIYAEVPDCEAIMRKIADCYIEIGKNYPPDENDFQEETDDYAKEIYNDIDECMTETDYIDEETVNYHLSNLYDFCDNLQIWIKL